MNDGEVRLFLSVSVLTLMSVGWVAKMNSEGTEVMDLSGLIAAVFVLGWLIGRY